MRSNTFLSTQAGDLERVRKALEGDARACGVTNVRCFEKQTEEGTIYGWEEVSDTVTSS